MLQVKIQTQQLGRSTQQQFGRNVVGFSCPLVFVSSFSGSRLVVNVLGTKILML